MDESTDKKNECWTSSKGKDEKMILGTSLMVFVTTKLRPKQKMTEMDQKSNDNSSNMEKLKDVRKKDRGNIVKTEFS